MSSDMRWRELKGKLAQETPKKPKNPEGNQMKEILKIKTDRKSYKTRKVKEMPAVPPEQFVPCKCKNKCSENFSMEPREKMHAQNWSMQSYDQHRQFKADTALPLTKKQLALPGESRKSWIWHYYLTRELEDGIIERVVVCKNVYYNTLQVKEKFVCVAVSSATSWIVKQDQRGKKAPANKTKFQTERTNRTKFLKQISSNLQMVHDHLNMFQKVESHYSRKDSKKLYIADNYNFHKLTIMKMYHL